ncbi:MAG: tetratricopeptide repeat protein [Nitrospirota bacterium]
MNRDDGLATPTKAEPGAAWGTWRLEALMVAAVLAITVAGYHGVVDNGWVLDDFHTVVSNRSIDTFDAFRWLSSAEGTSAKIEYRGYRPVLMASYALDRALWGRSAAGAHASNLVIHLGVVVIAFLLAKRLWGDSIAAVIAALVMAVHPLNAQAVNYITARSSSLMTLWILLAVWGYDRWVEARRDGGSWTGATWLGVAVIAALAALGTKEAAVVLPLLVMAWDRARRPDAPWRDTAVRSVPFWTLVAAFLAVRALILDEGPGGAMLGGAIQVVWFDAKLLVVSFIHWLWPTGLAIDYAWPWTISTGAGIGWVVACLALAAGTEMVRRWDRRFGWCVIWFWASLLPVLALPAITRLVLYQEHRSYLGGVGLAWCVGGSAAVLWRIASGRRRLRAAAGVTVVALTALALYADAGRTMVWRDAEHVWEDSLAKYPDSVLGRNIRARLWVNAGRLEDAQRELERALAIDETWGPTYGLLGVVFSMMKQYDRADRAFEVGLALVPGDSQIAMNRGIAYEQRGLPDQALAVYEGLLSRYPRHALALGRSAVLLDRGGRLDEAVERYRAILAIEPTQDEVRAALGAALARLGRWDDAERAFRELAARRPESGETWFNLGMVREQLGRAPGALDAYREAAARSPSDPDPEFRAGMIHARLGRWDDAAAAFERALARAPNHAESRRNLAIAAQRLADRGPEGGPGSLQPEGTNSPGVRSQQERSSDGGG